MSARVVDLFAGAGGMSTGAVMAGARVVAAVNHWPRAVETHAANHPTTEHFCEDAAIVDPTKLPDHEILCAGPSCVGHTRARGKEQPHHDAARATAWCVIRVAEAKMPRAILCENVPEMMKWRLYRAWRMALTDLGYRVAEQVIDAADAGVAQHRRRLFVTAVRGGRRPIVIPQPSLRHVTAREMLDLDFGPSTAWETLCAKTQARIEAGRREFGDEFLIAYYGSETGGRSLDRPIGTLTTVDRYAWVRGRYMRMLNLRELLRLSSFGEDYKLTGSHRDGVKLIGNAVPPLLARHCVGAVMEAA